MAVVLSLVSMLYNALVSASSSSPGCRQDDNNVIPSEQSKPISMPVVARMFRFLGLSQGLIPKPRFGHSAPTFSSFVRFHIHF